MRRSWAAWSCFLLLSACASVSTEPSGGLGAYGPSGGLADGKGLRAKGKLWVDHDALMAARTLRIQPIELSAEAAAAITPEQREIVRSAVGRSLCKQLGKRFEIAPADAPADLAVHVVVSKLGLTDPRASATSMVVGVVSPIRVPVGLGSLTVEGEARDMDGKQKAVLVWARGADIFTTGARVSSVGDAYQMAGAFSDDFARLLSRGEDPFRRRRLREHDGRPDRKPVEGECDAYGHAPGVRGALVDRLGLPPEWADRKANP